MNMDKKKIMSNVHFTPQGNSTLGSVDNYIYLGQTIHLGRSNFGKEINLRIQLSWATFGKKRYIFSSQIE